MPYKLPSTIPDGYRCVRVFVPDCYEAMMALKGSVHHLTKWNSWQRTSDKRALAMSNAFLLAWGLSFNGECDDMACDELLAAIEELRQLVLSMQGQMSEVVDMQIINNVGCGCGCGGSGGGGNWGDEENNPPGDSTPSPGGNTTDDNSWLCRASYDVVERHISFWNTVRTYSTIPSGTVRNILDSLLVFFDSGGEFATLMGVIGSWLSQGLAGLCVDALVAMREGLVSAIRTAGNSTQAKDAVTGYVWASQYPLYVRTALWAVFSLADWDMVFTVDSWDAPERDECQSVQPPGDCFVPEGYELVAPDSVVEEVSSDYTTASSLETGYEDACGGFAYVQYEAALTAKDQTFSPSWKAVTNRGDAIGFLVKMAVNQANGGNDPSELPVIRFHTDNDMTDLIAESGYIVNAPYTIAVVLPEHAANWASPVADVVKSLPVGTIIAERDFMMSCYRRSGAGNNRFGSCAIAVAIYTIISI